VQSWPCHRRRPWPAELRDCVRRSRSVRGHGRPGLAPGPGQWRTRRPGSPSPR